MSSIIKKDASYSFLLLRILTTLTASIRVTTTTELWSRRRRRIWLPGWVTKRDVVTDWLAGSAAAATTSKRACSAQWSGVCYHLWTHPSSETMFIGSLVAGCSVPTAVRTSAPDRLGRSVWRLSVDSITVADPRSWTWCLERSVLRCSAVAFHM